MRQSLAMLEKFVVVGSVLEAVRVCSALEDRSVWMDSVPKILVQMSNANKVKPAAMGCVHLINASKTPVKMGVFARSTVVSMILAKAHSVPKDKPVNKASVKATRLVKTTLTVQAMASVSKASVLRLVVIEMAVPQARSVCKESVSRILARPKLAVLASIAVRQMGFV